MWVLLGRDRETQRQRDKETQRHREREKKCYYPVKVGFSFCDRGLDKTGTRKNILVVLTRERHRDTEKDTNTNTHIDRQIIRPKRYRKDTKRQRYTDRAKKE